MSFDEMLTAPDAAAVKDQKPAKAPKRVASRKQTVVGGLPRVSLLPPEIKDAARTRVTRQILAGAVLLSVVITGGTMALASAAATAASDALTAENARTASLGLQVLKFHDVQALQTSIAGGQAAVKVGTSTQIDWNAQIADITAAMPAGYSIVTITADSASVFADYAQGSSPLEKPRAATVVLVVQAPDVVQLPIWLRMLRSIPAYADATADYAANEKGYAVTLTIHLSKNAIVRDKGRAR